jgi:hypothetical protein
MLVSVGLVRTPTARRKPSGGKLFFNAANLFRFQLTHKALVGLMEY